MNQPPRWSRGHETRRAARTVSSVLVLALALLAALALADEAENFGDQPICVDGVFNTGGLEYLNSDLLAYDVGSLFQVSPDSPEADTNAVALVGLDEDDRNRRKFAVAFTTRVGSVRPVAAGEVLASIKLWIAYRGVKVPAAVQAIGTRRPGELAYVVDLNCDGSIDTTTANAGITFAVSGDGTHLDGELGLVLDGRERAKACLASPVGAPVDIFVSPLPGGGPVKVASLSYSIDPTTFDTRANNRHVPVELSLDVHPGSEKNPVNASGKNGVVTIAILSSSTYDAAAKVALVPPLGPPLVGDPNLPAPGVAPDKITVSDVNRDGAVDLVLHVSVAKLVNSGAVVVGTTTLQVTGFEVDGDAVLGTDSVTTF